MYTSRIDPKGLYRIKAIVRPPRNQKDKEQSKTNPPASALIDVSAATWWAGVKSGRFPAPVRMGTRMTFWRGSDLLAFVEGVGASAPNDGESA